MLWHELGREILCEKLHIQRRYSSRVSYHLLYGTICSMCDKLIYLICINCFIVRIHDGVMGLVEGRIKEMHWSDVTGWVAQGEHVS